MVIQKKQGGFQSAGNVTYLDLCGGYIRVFTLLKGTELHGYDL